MIYPALTYLEEIGYASVEMEGTKKRYTLTEVGRNHYEQNREAAARILSDMERIGAQMAQARLAMESGLVPEESTNDATSDELENARRELRRAQRKEGPYTPGEARSVAEILNRAAADIRSLLAAS
jgi:DNA-binding PadR family transcriptional regulator